MSNHTLRDSGLLLCAPPAPKNAGAGEQNQYVTVRERSEQQPESGQSGASGASGRRGGGWKANRATKMANLATRL